MIVEGDDIYGEGVNTAARLQMLAPVGGVALSRVVKDQVQGKVACSFEDMGEHTVKDHDRPVQGLLRAGRRARRRAGREPASVAAKLSICVLPFSNMSGDTEQEYFSDGISEDIITDLSKVSALSVVARNTAFTFKGKSLKIPQVARELSVSHVLEGSVRKSGGRVRITAQLIDGAAGDHVWAERYDRNLDDIFALQDEISQAIVGALKLVLLPEEKKAIERRGTDNVEAYNLYLMARQNFTTGNFGDVRRDETVIRLCTRATEIDPSYARAWALLAMAQNSLRYQFARDGDGGQASVERALALDANLAEAHAVLALLLHESGRHDEALAELATALRLDPDSHEVNRAAAYSHFAGAGSAMPSPISRRRPPSWKRISVRRHADHLLHRDRRRQGPAPRGGDDAGAGRKGHRARPQQRRRDRARRLGADGAGEAGRAQGMDGPRPSHRSRQHEHALQLCLRYGGQMGDKDRAMALLERYWRRCRSTS
ncbi:MAG: hypothetical protein WDM81_04235 [Rhizomicrobium sp.]